LVPLAFLCIWGILYFGRMKKPLLVLIITCFFCDARLIAQTKFLDSIRAEIDKHPTRDTARVRLIQNYTKNAINENTTLLLPYVTEMISISKERNYRRGLQIAYSIQEIYYADRGDFPMAFLYADSAFMAFERDTSKVAIIEKAFLHHNLGMECFKIGDYEQAINHYTLAAEELEVYKPDVVSVVYDGMAEVYHKLLQENKSIEYDKKAIASAQKYGTATAVAGRYLNYITRLIDREQFNEAEELLNKVEADVKKNNRQIHLFLFHESKGAIHQNKKQFSEAITNFKQANKYALANEDVYQQLAILGPLAQCLMDAGQAMGARLYMDTLLNKSIAFQMKTYRVDAYTVLALWYQNKRDWKMANEFLNKKLQLLDTIKSDEMAEKIAMMETQYKVAGKDREIKFLQAEREIQDLRLSQKTTLNYFLLVGAITILSISLLAYRNYKHRQKLQQLKIEELEAEKQLAATAAVLKGEEQERTRLAKDLHDGLGGMLSGIKFSLNNMKGNLVMTPDNAQAFERSIDMLDSSIQEMRRVAHNMMPEILLKYGLDAALREFCTEIGSSGVIQMNYQPLGNTNFVIEQTTAVTLYRIVQELVNNVLKHAQAQNVLVQLHHIEQEKLLAVTVEDDGKGFDTSTLKQAGGMGWKNIQNRVEFLKGRIDMQSSAGKGTSVMIEITL
jgi:two-component system NarL family sensor kinase